VGRLKKKRTVKAEAGPVEKRQKGGFRLSLKGKFLLLYAFFVMLPFAAMGLYFFNAYTEYLKSNLISRSQNGFEQTSRLLSYYMYNVRYSMSDLVNSTLLHEIVEEDESVLSSLEQITDANRLRELLRSYSIKNEISDVRLYVDKQASYVSEDSIVRNIGDVKGEPWYEYAMERASLGVVIPPDIMGSADSIVYVKAMQSSRNYRTTIGLVRFDIARPALVDMMEQVVQGPEEYAYLINVDGRMICGSGDESLYVQPEELGRYSVGQARQMVVGGKSSIVCAGEIDNTDWYLVYVMPYARILGDLYSQAAVFLFVFLSLAALGLIFIYLFFKLFLNRVFQIQEHMSNIRNELPPPLPETGQQDEIGELVKSYNYMLSRVDVLLKEQYSLGNQMKEAEAKALYEQINPHFLYNTLSMIDWLAEEGNREDVSRVISELSNFYKKSLNKGNENITIIEELSIVESFVYIQNMRYGTAIALETRVEDIYENIVLPKLTLQPLVENSLVHGILMKRQKAGFIRIGVSSDSRYIRITVEDNGVGISPETLERLNAGTLQSSGGHYGVKNIMQRLTAYYGRECTLYYESEPGRLTQAVLTIPYS